MMVTSDGFAVGGRPVPVAESDISRPVGYSTLDRPNRFISIATTSGNRSSYDRSCLVPTFDTV